MMDGSIFRLPDVIRYVNLSRSAIYDRQNPDSPRYDETFPKKIFLGGGAVGWQKEDIDAWLMTCKERGKVTPKQPDSPNPAPEKQRSHATRKQPTPASNPSPAKTTQNLAGLVTKGIKQNTSVAKYLNMETWTPTMAALLICGVKAPIDCNEIPVSGKGLDDQILTQCHERFQNARRILNDWSYQDDPPLAIHPIDFFIWCDEERIDTGWLRIFRELAGCPVQESADLTASRLALL